jgi:hypothetical protein
VVSTSLSGTLSIDTISITHLETIQSAFEFSMALGFGQFEASRLFPSGLASFLGELLDIVSSRNRDAF